MKCLVVAGRFVLLVDIETASVKPLMHDPSGLYGISWFPNDPRLITASFGYGDNPNDSFETLARSEKGYLTIGDERTASFLSAPHQVCCANDGRIICTNTGRNSVVAVDLSRPGLFHEVRLSEGRWDRWDTPGIETSGDHLNSVFQRDDRLYVIAHRHNKGSRLATLSYPDMEILSVDPIADLTGLHNVWIGDDGEGLTCASHQGGLANVRTGEVLWASGESIYTRGLAISDDLILVGESTYTVRSSRRSSWAGLWIVNRRTMQTEDYIYLGPFGGVQEVRLLDVPDYAHHGQPFAGLDDMLQAKPLATTRDARLRAAKTARDRRAFWTYYRDVLGAISVDEDDWLAEREGYTCLVVQTETNEAEAIEFDYELADGESLSYVSVVLGFQGGYADTGMTALIVQQFHHTATVRIWQSRDGEWTSAETAIADDLPLSGTIRAARFADGVALSISGRAPIQISAEDLPLGIRPLGVRWCRSRVRISTPESA